MKSKDTKTTVLGVLGKSRKESEQRLPLHPKHLFSMPTQIRSSVMVESGYGLRFGIEDKELEAAGVGVGSRAQIMTASSTILIAKPTAVDLEEMPPGSVVCGWMHCVQQADVTQVAIDRELTLIAWECMYERTGPNSGRVHTFYRNNELAGYAGVGHSMDLVGLDGNYGEVLSATVISLGSVGRGAVAALQARGVRLINVITKRPASTVQNKINGCEYYRYKSAENGVAVEWNGEDVDIADLVSESDILVNATLQNPVKPDMFLRRSQLRRLRRTKLIVDVSCDAGMGFDFAEPTSFASPLLHVEGVPYYSVDHIPSLLWQSATYEISAALMPHMPGLLKGSQGWVGDKTLSGAVEILKGRVVNEAILEFQGRSLDYPYNRDCEE